MELFRRELHSHHNKILLFIVFFLMQVHFSSLSESSIRDDSDEFEFTCFHVVDDIYRFQVRGKILSLDKILRKQNCSGEVKFIEIFALEKIIIDKDFIKNEEKMQFNIIAPNWEIINNKVISLDAGIRENTWRASWNNRTPFSAETNNLQGPSGKPGGTIFAIIGKTINGKNLLISSNGGKGGDGQPATTTWLKKEGCHYLLCPANSGPGGFGGIPGVVQLFPLNIFSTLDVKLSVNNGTVGDEGFYDLSSSKEHFFRITGIPPSQIHDCNHDPKRTRYQPQEEPIVLENFEISVRRYRNFILSKTLECKCSDYAYLYVDIGNSKVIPNVYSILNLVGELTFLEKYYSIESNKMVTKNLLNAWYQGSEGIARRVSIENSYTDDDKIAISRLRETISNKIQYLKVNYYYQSIGQFESYLSQYLEKIQVFKNAEILNNMDTATHNITNALKEEIEEANKLISTILVPKLEEKVKDLKEQIKKLVDEIDAIIKQNKATIEEYKTLKLKLEEMRKFQIMFGILQVLCLALTFINPVGGMIGAGLSVTFDTLQSSIIDNEFSYADSTIVTGSMNRNYQTFKDLKEMSGDSKVFMKGINKVNNGFNLVQVGMETAKGVSKTNKEIEKLDKKIKETEEEIKKLEELKVQIHEKLEPMIDKMHAALVKKTNELHHFSITYLIFESWQLDDYLSNQISEIGKVTKNVKDVAFMDVMQELKKVVEVIIKMHKRMRELNTTITHVQHSLNIAKMPYEIFNFKGLENYKINLTNLIYHHYANDIIDEYYKIKNAFKQHSFPIKTELFSEVHEAIKASFADPLKKANAMVETLKSLNSSLPQLKTIIRPSFTQRKFEPGEYYDSFYTWNSNVYQSAINKILNGESVELFANISNYLENLNAVRFRNVEILFSSSNEMEHEQLKKDLQSFTASLIHNGDSYYKCKKKIFLIKSEAHNFGMKYNLSKKKRFNLDDTLNYVLSPFAHWTIRLMSKAPNGNTSILAKYVNKNISIDLVGEGQFLNFNEDHLCENQLSPYFGNEIIV